MPRICTECGSMVHDDKEHLCPTEIMLKKDSQSNYSPLEWLAILGEGFGNLSREVSLYKESEGITHELRGAAYNLLAVSLASAKSLPDPDSQVETFIQSMDERYTRVSNDPLVLSTQPGLYTGKVLYVKDDCLDNYYKGQSVEITHLLADDIVLDNAGKISSQDLLANFQDRPVDL
jgi:hypothetical protein